MYTLEEKYCLSAVLSTLSSSIYAQTKVAIPEDLIDNDDTTSFVPRNLRPICISTSTCIVFKS